MPDIPPDETRPATAALGAFLEGCGMGRGEYERPPHEVESALLLRAFDLVRYAIDRRPDHTPRYAARATLNLERRLRRNYR